MDFYNPTFSEISLSRKEVKVLQSFLDEKQQKANTAFDPLISQGLLKVVHPDFKKADIKIFSAVIITRRGQLYLKYLSGKRKEKFLLTGTFIASVLSVIISLLSLLK